MKHHNQKPDSMVSLRLPASILKSATQIAKAKGQSRSEYLRRLIARAVKRAA